MIRTSKEIQDKIDKLVNERNNLPEYNFFGDNNWVIIDTEIDILEGKIIDYDEIYDMEDDLGESGVSDCITALDWVNGEEVSFYDED